MDPIGVLSGVVAGIGLLVAAFMKYDQIQQRKRTAIYEENMAGRQQLRAPIPAPKPKPKDLADFQVQVQEDRAGIGAMISEELEKP